jgi:hypothetical protein
MVYKLVQYFDSEQARNMVEVGDGIFDQWTEDVLDNACIRQQNVGKGSQARSLRLDPKCDPFLFRFKLNPSQLFVKFNNTSMLPTDHVSIYQKFSAS